MSGAEKPTGIAFVPELEGRPQLRSALELALNLARAHYPNARAALEAPLERRSMLLRDFAREAHDVEAEGLEPASKDFLFRY